MRNLREIVPLVAALVLAITIGAQGQVRLHSANLAGAGGFTGGPSIRVGVTMGQTLSGFSNDALNANGAGFWYTTLNAITIVSSSIERLGDEIPEQYELNQNYPNPFNPTTRIKYGLPESGRVRLTIFNVLGQIVTVILDREQTAGYYEVNWDARSGNGVRLPSGLYFYRIDADGFTSTRSMVLQK